MAPGQQTAQPQAARPTLCAVWADHPHACHVGSTGNPAPTYHMDSPAPFPAARRAWIAWLSSLKHEQPGSFHGHLHNAGSLTLSHCAGSLHMAGERMMEMKVSVFFLSHVMNNSIYLDSCSVHRTLTCLPELWERGHGTQGHGYGHSQLQS